MGTKPDCSLGPLGPASRQRSPWRQGQGGVRAWRGHWEMQGAWSPVPIAGEPATQKQERAGQGHMTVGGKTRFPSLPEPSRPGFRTLKTHPFSTLDCTPGVLSSHSQSHWLKPWLSVPWLTCASRGCSCLASLGRGWSSHTCLPCQGHSQVPQSGLSIAVAAPDLRLDHEAC